MDRDRIREAVDALAHQHIGGWGRAVVSAALTHLPDCLDLDERPLIIARADHGSDLGLLALTDRRAIFLRYDGPGKKEVRYELPYPLLTSIETTKNKKLHLTAGDDEFEFSISKDVLPSIADTIRERTAAAASASDSLAGPRITLVDSRSEKKRTAPPVRPAKKRTAARAPKTPAPPDTGSPPAPAELPSRPFHWIEIATDPAKEERRAAIEALAERTIGAFGRATVRAALKRLPDYVEPDERPLMISRADRADHGTDLGLLALTDRRAIFLRYDGPGKKEIRYELPYHLLTNVETISNRKIRLAAGDEELKLLVSQDLVPALVDTIHERMATAAESPGSLAELRIHRVERGFGKRKALKRFEERSLPELMREVPELVHPEWGGDGTIYDADAEAWFETLFERTFQAQNNTAESRELLTAQYVRLLAVLETALEQAWPSLWQGRHEALPWLTGPDYVIDRMTSTLTWLRAQCEAQREQLRRHQLEAGSWDAELFEWWGRKEGSTGATLAGAAVGGAIGAGLMGAASVKLAAIRIACTPRALKKEIERTVTVA